MDIAAVAYRAPSICSGVNQFYSALDSRATYGIGKKQKLYIFSAHSATITRFFLFPHSFSPLKQQVYLKILQKLLG